LHLLDELDSKNIKFALSNVFYHKGKTNEELIKWSEQYEVTYLDKKYSNCSYHLKDRDARTVEVLVTNYKWDVMI
jgi:DNA adenine methylase